MVSEGPEPSNTSVRDHLWAPSPLDWLPACGQIHFTRHFSHAVCTIHFMHITLHGSSVCMRASFHLHVIHDERLIVRSLLLLRYVFLRDSLCCLLLLFHTLLALWLALLLPWGQRQGRHLLRLRPMRSIAPWRYTILPQVMSPTSLTTSTTQRLLK